MKTKINLFCAAALMSALCAGFVACNEPKGPEQSKDKEGTEIKPVKVDEVSAETATFLDANLSYIVTAVGEYRSLLKGKDFCTMINSVDELPKVFRDGTPFELPAIDFDSYTLVLGGWYEGQGGRVLTDKSLVVGSEKIIMYIHTETPPGFSGTTSPVILPYGELYPKLPSLPIDVVRK